MWRTMFHGISYRGPLHAIFGILDAIFAIFVASSPSLYFVLDEPRSNTFAFAPVFATFDYP